MSAYRDEFVVCVKKDGQVLRESKGRVYLPFYSEYSLLLKNNSFHRGCAKVTIDGMDALGGYEIVVPTFGSVDLERFCIDGNLNNGNKFLFVPVSDSRIQDPSSPSLGKIVVEFWKESKNMYTEWKDTRWWISYPEYTHQYIPKYIPSETDAGWSAQSNSYRLCNYDKGGTVEGSTSQQSFTTTTFKKDLSTYTKIELEILPHKTTMFVSNQVYCTKCGKKLRSSFIYCPKCGTKR